SDQTTFCDDPPYLTTFTNNSAYTDPATTFSWDFGDGNTSTAVSPDHEFSATGQYNVQLVVSNPNTGCSDSYRSEINIFSFDDAPGIITADATQGCAPLSVNFSQEIASRLSSNYVVTGYHWDFDNDGSIDSTTLSPSIQHQYLQPGSYSVRLLVSSESCDYEFTENNMIRVSGPIAGFSHSPLQTCLNSNISFTNTTTKTGFDTADPANNTYDWDFGDGNTSNEQHPVHAFSSDGVFTVSMTVTDENGCSSTLVKPDLINIVPFEPAFELSDSVFCSNEAVVFDNLSTGDAVAYHWDFNGDAVTDLVSYNLQAVQHTYPVQGTYTVTLTALAANGCSKTFTQNIRVVNATANFTASSTNIGCAPAFAYFHPETGANDAISYHWNFGDGNNSSERSPRNYYVTPGKYTVTLQVQFKGGCSRTLTKTEYITVDGAYGVFNYDKTLGCAPNPVLFTVSQLSRATYVDWDFGTGIIDRDTLPSSGTTTMETIYAYDTLGFRTPKIILTDLVCGEYAYENLSKGSIYTSTPPVPGFTVDFDSICRGVEIQFTDTSLSYDPLYAVSSWKWDFGTSAQDSSKVQHPTFKYQNQGIYSPQLIVTNELGCSDTLRKNNSIHIYSNELLSSAFAINDTLACAWQPIIFTSEATAGPSSTVSKYEWNFGNGFTSGNPGATYAFHDSLKGQTIDIIHRVTDDKFCIDSTIRTVAINHLQAAFGYDPQPVFRGSLVDFSDQSTSDFSTTVTGWSWNFENGAPGSSTARHPQDIGYNNIADDNGVRLIVTNSNNCRDTLTMNLSVLNNPPVVDTFTITLVENHPYKFRATEFSSRFDAADPAQSMQQVRIENNPANGSFLLNGLLYTPGTPIPANQLATLEFLPAPDWNGNTQFLWNAFDGIDWAMQSAWVYVVVLEEPDPPVLSDIVFNLPEDSVIEFGQQYFINHTASVLGSSFLFDSLTILTALNPNLGTLTFNNLPVTVPLLIRDFHINDTDSLFRYVPLQAYNGTLEFTWNVHDGYNFSDNPARVILNYYNTAPVVSDIVYTNIQEDLPQFISKAQFTMHYSDVDVHDSPQQFYLSNLPPDSEGAFWYNGQHITSNNFSVPYNQFNEIRFFPAHGFEGTTQATWGISDGTDIGWAQIQFTFVNTPPVVHDFTVSGAEDQTMWFSINDFEKTGTEHPFEDADAWDKLQTITIQSLPAFGQLTYNGTPVSAGLIIDRANIGLLSYLSGPDWYGTDQFDYNATDGTDPSADDALVILSILPVNDAPRPQPDFYSIQEDEVLTGVSVGENDTDIDDQSSVLRFHVAATDSASAGANGTIYLNQLGYLTYVPKQDFHGTVKFAYTVCDDDGACAQDTVTINIVPENDPPVAVRDTFVIYEDEVSALFNCITNNDNDVDGDVISLMEVESDLSGFIATAYGELSWDNQGALIFTLAGGLDTLSADEMIDLYFDYMIEDSWNASGNSTFIIRIMGRNNPPLAVADEYNTYEGETAISSGMPDYPNILSNDTDPENDPLQVYTVNNQSETNIVTPYGTFDWNSNGSWTFNQNLTATDSLYQGEYVELIFPYTNTDGVAQSVPSVITFNIIGVNDAPVAADNYLEIFEDVGSIAILVGVPEALLSNDRDVDGDQIRVIEIEGTNSSPLSSDVGILEWNADGSYTYTPDIDSVKQLAEGQSITDIFTYVIQDAFGASDTARLIINITGKNDAPFAQDDYLSINEDTHITEVDAANGLLINDGDIDHDPIVVAVNGVGTRTLNGNYGTLTWDSTGAFTYVTNIPVVDTLYQGEAVIDIFTYVVNDPSGETDMAVLTITIIGENDAPVAVDHTDSISENDQFLTISTRETGIISKSSDIDDGLNFGIDEIKGETTSPVNGTFGTLEWNTDGTFTYTLNPGTDTLSFNEVVIDSFLFQIRDAFDSTATAWFYMVITGENDEPLAQNDTLRVDEDILMYAPDWSLLENDGDRDGDPIGMSLFGGQASSPLATRFASFEWDREGNFVYMRYVPNSIFNGLDTLAFDDLLRDSILYSIVDQYGVESTASLVLEIQGVNDPPVTRRDVNFISEMSLSVASNASNGLLSNDREVDRRDSVMLHRVNNETTFSTEGKYGTLTWNSDGSYVYYNRFESTDSLAQSERVHDLFPYSVIDLQGAISTDTLDITIIGSNDRPVAVNDTISIREDEQFVEIHPATNGLMWNDYDVDGDSIKVQLAGNALSQELMGTYGILTINADGQAIYRLNPGLDTLYHGEILVESFPYTIADIHGVKDEALIRIVITGDNDAPQAFDEFYTIDEDTEQINGSGNTSLRFNDFDLDGDSLKITMDNNDPYMLLEGFYGQLIWEPNGEFSYLTNLEITNQLAFGDTVQDVFTYVVYDPFGGTDTTQLTIEITGVNDAPVALANYYSTLDVMAIQVAPTDTTTFVYNDFDVDGSIQLVTLVNELPNDTVVGQWGSLIWQPDGSFIYLPDSANAIALRPDESNTDQFIYTIEDEWGATDTSTINFIIEGINNGPTARNDTIFIMEDDLTGILEEALTFNDWDPDGDTLVVNRVENDTTGIMTGFYGEVFWQGNGQVVFTPNRNIIDQLGPDDIKPEPYTYTVVDEGGITAQAELIIYIIGENDPVVANNDTVSLFEDSYVLVEVMANDTDVDNNLEGNWAKSPVSITIPPQNGNAFVNSFNGVISYFPDDDFNGSDSLQYRVCDEEGSCDLAWVQLNIIAVNDPPVATHLILKTNIDTPVSFNAFDQVEDIDDGVDPGSLVFDNVHLSVQDSILTYTPESGFSGHDEFIYSLADYDSARAYVIVTVLIPDGGDGAQDDIVTTAENTPVNIAILLNDTLNGFVANPLSVDIKIFPVNGVAAYDPFSQLILYQPANNFNGTDQLTYLVSSEAGIWDYATVFISVEPVNSPIEANDDARTTNINQNLIIPVLLNDVDEDNGIDYQSFEFLSQTNHGNVTYNPLTGLVSFQPETDYKGNDQFTYRICDLDPIQPSCDSATVYILVKSKFDDVQANNDTISTPENTAVLITYEMLISNDVVEEGSIDSTRFTILSFPHHGEYAKDSLNNIMYIPADHYFGPDWMTYQICDDNGSCDMAEINIWVIEKNSKPVTGDDYYVVTENTTKRLYILSNDFDYDGTLDWSTLALTSDQPENGSVEIDHTTGTIFYTPSVNASTDDFSYRICDNDGECSEGKVYITIDLGSTILYNQVTYEDTPDTIDLEPLLARYNFNDPVLDYLGIDDPEKGSWEFIDSNTRLVYYPAQDETGADFYNIQLFFTGPDTADLKVTVTIIPVNDAPVALPDPLVWP
ncbi:MAG: tandem-95 repeat protein, partial [Prolixibacteraceae bacterium]|nr:tandem-95 repeat protein [Prolixibacteraceae bacterium]